MKKDNLQPLEEALKDYVKQLKLSGKLNEVKLIREWENLIGKTIARSTTKIYIQDNILHVYIRSSVIKNELMYIRTALLTRINQMFTEEFIKELVIH